MKHISTPIVLLPIIFSSCMTQPPPSVPPTVSFNMEVLAIADLDVGPQRFWLPDGTPLRQKPAAIPDNLPDTGRPTHNPSVNPVEVFLRITAPQLEGTTYTAALDPPDDISVAHTKISLAQSNIINH